MKKRLAMNKNGEITFCTAPEDKIGQGKCNHIAHIDKNQTTEDFINDCSFLVSNKIIINDTMNQFLENDKTRETLTGAQSKFIKLNNIFKIDNSNSMFGVQRNSLSEEMACLLERNIKDFDYVEYKSCSMKFSDKEVVATICENFKKANDDFIDFRSLLGNDLADELIVEEYDYDYYNEEDEDDEEYLYVDHTKELNIFCNKIKEITKLDIKNHLLRIISLDLLTLNYDRSLNNIGVIFNQKTKTFRLAPCFDNGDSLFSYADYDDIKTIEDFEEKADRKLRLSTFGLTDNNSYINLVKENIDSLIELDLNKAINDIKGYKNDLYDSDIVERNKKFLIHRLNKYEGILFRNTNIGD